MDLGFPRFDPDLPVAALPSDLAILIVGVAARQALSPTAMLQEVQSDPAGSNGLLAPASGAFSRPVAASIAGWKQE